MKDTPKKIYLQVNNDDFYSDEMMVETSFIGLAEVTWSDERINKSDLEYTISPLTAKQMYKQFRGKQRKESNKRVKLIHALINIRSHGFISWYKNLTENDRQNLIWVLRGNKTWSGDVLSYFIRKYPLQSQRPSTWVSLYGNRYVSPDKRKPTEIEELPF